MRYTFPSLDKPSERYCIYELSSDNKGYDYGTSKISPHLAVFETYGDGDVQHTPDWCPTNDGRRMLDFCRSVMGHLTKLPTPELFSAVASMFLHHETLKREVIQFIQKTRYDENKYHQYACVADCKKSSAESKQYDKRWTRIDSRWDGSYKNIRSILYEGDLFRYTEPFQSIWLDIQIAREFGMYAWSVAQHYGKMSHTIFSCLTGDELDELCRHVENIAMYCQTRKEADRMAYCIERQANYIAEAAAKTEVASET